jgi:hypothetical protein
MRIFELFGSKGSSKDIEWHRLHGNALGGAGYEIIVRRRDDEPLEYVLDLAATPIKGLFEVSFALIKDGDWSQKIEGTGSAFLVFSGVADALRDWQARTPSAMALYFTAKEPSRTRLYRKMAVTMAKELGWETNPELARLMSGGWEGDYQPFVVVKPGSADEVAKSITSDDEG